MRLHNRESAEDDAPELEELGRPDHVDHDALRKIRDLVDELDRRE
jgi:hypothetical protein